MKTSISLICKGQNRVKRQRRSRKRKKVHQKRLSKQFLNRIEMYAAEKNEIYKASYSPVLTY